MRPGVAHRLSLSTAFVSAAHCYWLKVFPVVRREVRYWRVQAEGIPDSTLRWLALNTYRTKWSNIEGAAAFATLAPSAYRSAVIRGLVTFQVAYDYADTLSERPSQDPIANGYALHQPLIVALGEKIERRNYYAYNRLCRDGGYLEALTDSCRKAVHELPSYSLVREAANRAAERIAAYQSLHQSGIHAQSKLATWASRETPPGIDLRWWETAAACASSLTVLALLAAAADPELTATQAAAIERSYHPWIGALHTLLDSLVDWSEDELAGQPSLLSNYAPGSELKERMRVLTERSCIAASMLAHSERHLTILAGMVGVYLSTPEVRTSRTAPTVDAVLAAAGCLAKPSLMVVKARRIMQYLSRGHDIGTASRL